MSTKTEVRGIAAGLDRLFVAQKSSREILVFDLKNFKENKCIKLKDLKDPWDIVQSADHLYVSDREQKIIHIYNITSRTQEKPWDTQTATSATLSVTPEGDIVASFSSLNKILLYSPTAEDVLAGIRVEVYDVSLSHSVRIKTGEYVICDVFGEDHRIVKLSRKWDLVWDFKKPCNSEMSDALNMYLIGAGKDYILVADQANNRILLLDIYLELVKELILPKHVKKSNSPKLDKEQNWSIQDLVAPFRMCLDLKHGKLFVAEENQSKVKIFSFESTP